MQYVFRELKKSEILGILEVHDFPNSTQSFFDVSLDNNYNKERIKNGSIPVIFNYKKLSKIVGNVDCWDSGVLKLNINNLITSEKLIELVSEKKLDICTYGTGECLADSEKPDPQKYRLEKIYFQNCKEKK